jgi:hypothetical protein
VFTVAEGAPLLQGMTTLQTCKEWEFRSSAFLKDTVRASRQRASADVWHVVVTLVLENFLSIVMDGARILMVFQTRIAALPLVCAPFLLIAICQGIYSGAEVFDRMAIYGAFRPAF